MNAPLRSIVLLLAAVWTWPAAAQTAVPSVLTLRHAHHLFTIRPAAYPSWRSSGEEWTFHARPFVPPSQLRVDGDVVPPLPDGVERDTVERWDIPAIRATLADTIGRTLERDAGRVVIDRTASGAVVFDGVGMLGRTLDVDAAATLVAAAMEQGVSDIILPVRETQPVIEVRDATLRAAGIREVVAVGESEFAGSPAARRHNIAVGLSKFNGHLIPSDTVFSFNDVLGPVNGQTGYKKELVILGDKTLPDYGGGLCQVSTTAYRGIWEYGLPIVDRRNHSYSVRYYNPQGTDATIYPPSTDMQFRNDTPGALLMQTVVEGDRAYFLYYGTRDDRTAEVVGPYTWAHTPPPPDRVEETTDIPPGTTRKVGERVPGLRAAWFRIVQRSGAEEEVVEPVYSVYEARPLFYQRGVEPSSIAAPDAADSDPSD